MDQWKATIAPLKPELAFTTLGPVNCGENTCSLNETFESLIDRAITSMVLSFFWKHLSCKRIWSVMVQNYSHSDALQVFQITFLQRVLCHRPMMKCKTNFLLREKKFPLASTVETRVGDMTSSDHALLNLGR